MKNIKLSKYSYSYTKNGKYFVFSCISNAFLEISERLYKFLVSGFSLPHNKVTEDEILRTLLRLKIILSEEAENQFFDQLKIKFLSHNFQNSHLSLTILPTQNCNLCCPYCFEGNKKNISMSKKTREAIIHFLKHQPAKTLSITWFGGEPMLQNTVIYRLLNEISSLKDIKLTHHSMVTNGTLLEGKCENTFIDFPLNEIQVTIDGKKDTHDAIRCFPDGRGTFQIIKRNILHFHKTFPSTKISFRINVSKKNFKEYKDIVEELSRWFETKNRNFINIYPGIIKKIGSDITDNACLDKNEESDMHLELKKIGFSYWKEPHIKLGGCGATRLMSLVIGADGSIYKCWEDVGKINYILGNINENIICNKLYSDYLLKGSKFSSLKCRECTFFPICDGGCPKQRIENNENEITTELCTLYSIQEGRLLKQILTDKYQI